MHGPFTYITNTIVEVKLLLSYYTRKLLVRAIWNFNVVDNINFVIFLIFLSLLLVRRYGLSALVFIPLFWKHFCISLAHLSKFKQLNSCLCLCLVIHTWLTNESSFLSLFITGVLANLFGILPLYGNIVATTTFGNWLVVFVLVCQTREYGREWKSNPRHLPLNNHDDPAYLLIEINSKKKFKRRGL